MRPKKMEVLALDEMDWITERIIGAGIEVHRTPGPGLLESTYHACLVHELREQGLEVEEVKILPVVYKGATLDCGYRIDVPVEKTVIVELKAVEDLTAMHEAQLLSHLKLSGCPVGLLINLKDRQ
jgi:GxxExxY protein